ncbi:trimeric intracellular cation channel family protein [Clostridium sp. KNHs214]|uniref:trimeric intracellular cation channel family protein n=1 Tax=Clostridium sp. KNHs214 TaxID=1540257 RepID=UPI000555EA84|nr:trimeric intracellular cation channel family protein [Clostridium sp. KNHs214]
MILMNFFEILGTIAFAISGALLGVQKKLDIFGVSFLAMVTAVGGGIFRDIVIGTIPPAAFQDPKYCLISIGTAVITFQLHKDMNKLRKIILISDAIGLGIFTVIGANAAFSHGIKGIFIVVSTGLFTGIGGGILRDVSVQHIPIVFRKEIYAVASILGALAFYLCYKYISKETSIYIGFIVTFTVRIISVKYNLNLPGCEQKHEDLTVG